MRVDGGVEFESCLRPGKWVSWQEAKNRVMDLFSTCQITSEGVRISYLFFTKTIPISEIKSIRKMSLGKAFIRSMNPFRLPMWTIGSPSLSGLVLIETVKNRVIALSPKDGDEFVKLVSSHLIVSS